MRRGELDSRLLILVTLALVAFGLVMVYSATSAAAAVGGRNPTYYLERQGIYGALGIVLMILAQRWDYRRLKSLAPMLVLVSFVLLVAVLVVRAADQRCAPLDLVRAGRLPAVRAGQARPGDLGCGVPLTPEGAADARRSCGGRSAR